VSGSSSDTYEQRLSTGGRLERVGLAVAIAGVAICTLWASQSGFTKLSPIISLGFWAVVSVVLALSVARPRVWLAQFDANRCLLIAPGFELNVTWSQVSDIHVDDGCAIVAFRTANCGWDTQPILCAAGMGLATIRISCCEI